MVTADFRREAEFTLFLRMRTKQIAKSPGKYIPIEELFPYCQIAKFLSPS